MVLVIMPLVKEAHRRRPRLRMAAYAIALVTTATLIGMLVSALGLVVVGRIRAASAAVAMIAILYSLREAGAITLPLPSSKWQVPASWAKLGYQRSGAIYGAALGLGFLTRTPYATYHVMLLWQFVAAAIATGAALGFAYGVARFAGMFLASSIAARRTSGTPLAIGQWIFGQSSVVRCINATCLSLFGGCVLAHVL